MAKVTAKIIAIHSTDDDKKLKIIYQVGNNTPKRSEVTKNALLKALLESEELDQKLTFGLPNTFITMSVKAGKCTLIKLHK